jgi:hypothetical protein
MILYTKYQSYKPCTFRQEGILVFTIFTYSENQFILVAMATRFLHGMKFFEEL